MFLFQLAYKSPKIELKSKVIDPAQFYLGLSPLALKHVIGINIKKEKRTDFAIPIYVVYSYE